MIDQFVGKTIDRIEQVPDDHYPSEEEAYAYLTLHFTDGTRLDLRPETDIYDATRIVID